MTFKQDALSQSELRHLSWSHYLYSIIMSNLDMLTLTWNEWPSNRCVRQFFYFFDLLKYVRLYFLSEWNLFTTSPGSSDTKEPAASCLCSGRSKNKKISLTSHRLATKKNPSYTVCVFSGAGLWLCLEETVRRVSTRTPPIPSSLCPSPSPTRAIRTFTRSTHTHSHTQSSITHNQWINHSCV